MLYFYCILGGNIWEYLKILPHCWNNEHSIRYFATTVEEFKQWLAEEFINNPVMLQLVTSTSSKIIPYNEIQQAQYNAIKQATSEDDITIISSESDELGFDMNVIAVADANKVINSFASVYETSLSKKSNKCFPSYFSFSFQ